jgi:hypothetical protein
VYAICWQHTPLPEIRTYVSAEQPRRHSALRKSLKPSVVLLLLYYKQTMTIIVPVTCVHCNNGSESQSSSVFSVTYELII